MNWLHYLLEANLYLGIFYLAYYIFLSKETYYTFNRVYLLLTCVLSFVLPVVQLGVLRPSEPALQTVYLLPPAQVSLIKPAQVILNEPAFTWQNALLCFYLTGAAVLLLLLIVKLYQLFKLTKNNQKLADTDYKLVYLTDSNTAFSFFNVLFIGTKTEGTETIIKHELVHIRQKHSADVVFIEFMKIINWFNPFIYLLQISLKTIHEYIADEKTATTEGDALIYSSFLVSNAYGLSGSSITHSFFNYNLLKKRIIMLNQKRSGNLARLKYLVAVPMCAGMLCASTLAFSKSYELVDLFPKKADTNHIAPPPQPIQLTDVRLLPIPPAPPKNYGYTVKGYKYKLRKYTIGDKTNYVVSIYEKNGSRAFYASNGTSPAQRAVLYEKYGYTFPAAGKYGAIKSSVRFPPPVVRPNTAAAPQKMPPPPPAPPAKVVDNRPPPPPPFDPVYKNLMEYLGRHVRYPASALQNHVTGAVEVQFNLGSDHKITNIKVVKGDENALNDEVIRVMKEYPGTISTSGNHPFYLAGVTFNIMGANSKKLAGDFNKDFSGSENYTFVANVYGYIKDDIK